VRLFARIERIFGKRFPLSVLFQAPTVEQLADLLRQAGWSSSWSSLVPIQPQGSNPPLFCLPGNLGNVFLDLGDLAPYLGPEQPIYGLQDGIQNPSQIHALAAHYIDEIRSLQPEGPYLLAGICSGGVVAFEMAQQLRAQAQEVALLALVEPTAPSHPGWGRYVAAIFSILRSAVQRLTHHSRVFLQNASTERGTYAQLKAKVIANMWAVAQYVPHPYPGRIALFLAEDSSASGSPDARINWGEMAGDGMEVHTVPGSHEAITRTGVARPESQAQVLAKNLKFCIERALTETH
jgi:thioesterase domain-containing protein